jgi:hypothetical protein
VADLSNSYHPMTVAIQEILDRFDGLTEPEQFEAAREILRRVPTGELPPFHDDELVDLLEPRDESARRARIAAMTPSDEDLEAAASPPPAEWYQEDWSK